MAAQPGDDALQRLAGLLQYAGLDDPPGRERVHGLGSRGLDHVPAPAGLDLDKAPGLQLHQRFAHHGAADVEVVGQLLLSQSFAGCQFLGQDGFDDAFRDVLWRGRSHCLVQWLE
ncbi:hypothetical protein SDC9_211592 [bioreactor metagenome]|uniref:Uncharacterized protein n=1 Tax=bioreactor metagenome TaxID=1076179 RepID=A0A645JK79_9ZZZZ